MLIRPANHAADIAPWISRAAREGAALRDSPRTSWWSGVVDGEPVACIGLIDLGRKLRIRGAYTLPAHRGQGIGSQLLAYVVGLASTTGKPIEAYVLSPAAYEALGFRVLRRRNERSYIVWRTP